MKHFLLFCLLLISYSSYSQTVKSGQVIQKQLIKLVENMESLETFEGRRLWGKILRVSDGAGSANRAGTEETAFSIYVCVSQYDEYPESTLFKIGPFNNPKVTDKVDSKSGDSFTLLVMVIMD
jgi:hypothetical protein